MCVWEVFDYVYFDRPSAWCKRLSWCLCFLWQVRGSWTSRRWQQISCGTAWATGQLLMLQDALKTVYWEGSQLSTFTQARDWVTTWKAVLKVLIGLQSNTHGNPTRLALSHPEIGILGFRTLFKSIEINNHCYFIWKFKSINLTKIQYSNWISNSTIKYNCSLIKS